MVLLLQSQQVNLRAKPLIKQLIIFALLIILNKTLQKPTYWWSLKPKKAM